MASVITGALDSFTNNLQTVATTAVAIGAAALLAWCGFRLAAKLTNRGVGK